MRARRGLCALPPRREERRSPPCPARPDLNPPWPRAQPGSASRLACPGDQRGEARWDCGLWGLRTSDSPDYSDCNVLQDITSLLTNLREDQAGPTEVLEEINEDIRRSEKRLGGGDIISVVELLDTAVSLQQARTGQEEERLEDSSSFLAASLETVNNLGETNNFLISYLLLISLSSLSPCLKGDFQAQNGSIKLAKEVHSVRQEKGNTP